MLRIALMIALFILGLALAIYGYFFAIKFTKYKPYPHLPKAKKEENLKGPNSREQKKG